MASAGEDDQLLLWAVDSSTVAKRLERGADEITTLTFSQDGQWLFASTDKGELERYDVRRGELSARVPVPQKRIRAAVPVGAKIYVAGDDKTVRAYAVPSSGTARAQSFSIPTAIRGVRFVGDGEGLTLLGTDRLVVFDLVHRRTRSAKERQVGERPVAISNDGEWVAVADANEVRVAHVGRSDAHRLRTSGAPLGAIAFSNDRKTIAVAASDGFVRLLSLEGEMHDEVVRVHDGAIDAIAFTADDAAVITGGFDGKVAMLEVGKGATPRRIATHEGGATAVAATEDLIASGGREGAVRLHVRRAKETIDLEDHEGAVRALAFSRDGRYLASGGADRTVRIWDTMHRRLAARLPQAHADEIVGVEFGPDDRVLASVAEDGSVRVWSLTDLPPRG
jgi:WD40 repeat protein